MTQSVILIHDALEKPFARQLAIDLSLAGATVKLDEAEIGETQDPLIRYIVKDVLGDVCLAIILTPNSAESDWVHHEVEFLMNQQVTGLTVKVMPLLYKDCTIPAFMADKLCADFRDPANYNIMLLRVIDCLELEGNGRGPAVPASHAGMWQGSWIWCGRQRIADMFLSASPNIPSKMIIRYLKSGVLTIVEQQLEVRISGKDVTLIGTDYLLIERGISLGWSLDTFKLSMGASGGTLEGINTDKRGTQSLVLFKRK
jgi:hypothetical protein